MKKRTKLIIGLIAGIILIIIWLRLIDVQATFQHLSQLNLFFIILASLVLILRYYLRATRWQIILSPIKKIKSLEAFALSMSGYFINYIFPVHMGEVGQCYLLKKRHQIPIAKSFPTIFVDKFCDLSSVILLFVLLPFFPGELDDRITGGVIIVLVLYLCLFAILIFSVFKKELAIKLLEKIFFFAPQKYKHKVREFIENFVAGMAVARQLSKKIIVIILITLVALVLDAALMWCMFAAIGFWAPEILIFFGSLTRNLFYALPMPPGQIGSTEMLWYLIFVVSLGFNVDQVSAATATSHILTALLIGLMGIYSLSYIGFSLRKIFKKI